MVALRHGIETPPLTVNLTFAMAASNTQSAASSVHHDGENMQICMLH